MLLLLYAPCLARLAQHNASTDMAHAIPPALRAVPRKTPVATVALPLNNAAMALLVPQGRYRACLDHFRAVCARGARHDRRWGCTFRARGGPALPRDASSRQLWARRADLDLRARARARPRTGASAAFRVARCKRGAPSGARLHAACSSAFADGATRRVAIRWPSVLAAWTRGRANIAASVQRESRLLARAISFIFSPGRASSA